MRNFEVLEQNVKAERAARDAARDAYWKTQLQTERDTWHARETQLQNRIAELEGRH
ncbi:MAG: hypothetical protein LBR16_03225 [Treponema sp.]|nr:hypothetical protein [Treponema sp.]